MCDIMWVVNTPLYCNCLMRGIMYDIMWVVAIMLNIMHGIMCDIMWLVNTQLYWIA